MRRSAHVVGWLESHRERRLQQGPFVGDGVSHWSQPETGPARRLSVGTREEGDRACVCSTTQSAVELVGLTAAAAAPSAGGVDIIEHDVHILGGRRLCINGAICVTRTARGRPERILSHVAAELRLRRTQAGSRRRPGYSPGRYAVWLQPLRELRRRLPLAVRRTSLGDAATAFVATPRPERARRWARRSRNCLT